MSWYDNLVGLKNVREALMDEESKVLLDARINYFCTRNQDDFINVIYSIPKKWRCIEILEHQKGDSQEIIIFGCGYDGKKQKEILDLCQLPLSYWCDNNKERVGTYVDNSLVLSVDEVVENHRNSLVIIGSRKYANEMYDDLISRNFPSSNILRSQFGILVANCGKQYFDIFEPEEMEYYIDAGSYNGDTIFDYLSWVNGKNKKIYAMEPLEEMVEVIKKRIDKDKVKNVIVNNNAAWNRKEELFFRENGSGSSVCIDGKRAIRGIDIDTMVGTERITFIKMDIEGAELKALEGAKETIIRNKPKLAICIYHKPEDVILISEYILKLNPEYKLYIRHYASNMWETVLYAVP